MGIIDTLPNVKRIYDKNQFCLVSFLLFFARVTIASGVNLHAMLVKFSLISIKMHFLYLHCQ